MKKAGTLLRISECAERLGVSHTTVHRLIDSAQLDCLRVGPKSFRVPRTSLEHFIERRSSRATEATR